MTYPDQGTFVTERREIAISETWDTWQNPQSQTETVVDNGSIKLEWSEIPDSAVLQYYADTWSSGDATWTDDLGNADISLNGGPSEGTLSDGSEAISTDGTDDRGELTLPAEFEGSSLNEFSIEVALQYSHSDETNWFGLRQGSTSQWIQVYANRDYTNASDAGNFYFTLKDNSDNTIWVGPSSNPNINDGNRHDVSIIINDSTVPDVSIIIDGSSVSVSYDSSRQDSLSDFGTWDRPLQIWARDLDGPIGNYFAAEMGAMRWHDSAISEQTINYY